MGCCYGVCLFVCIQSWCEYAKELLEELVCKDFAEVFLHPVDIIEYQVKLYRYDFWPIYR